MSTLTAAAYRLGKLPARRDPRTLRLARYLDTAALPPAPDAWDEATGVGDWPMYANDRVGDCTCAAAGHMIEAWTHAGRGHTVTIAERDVLRAFDAVKLVDPTTGAEGAVELDVLNLWRKHGIGRHRILAYAKIDRADHELVRQASVVFGGAYIGLQLPLTAQRQSVWQWTGRLRGPARPGSWGGHAVDVVAYDDETLTVVTWGRLQRLTWEFWNRYCDEAYAVLSRDFLSHGRAPNGLDLDALLQDLALVSS